MKIVGLHVALMGYADHLIEWTCPPDTGGLLIALSIAPGAQLDILEFNVCRKDGTIERFVDSKKRDTSPAASFPPKTWEGGVDAHCFEQLMKEQCGVDLAIEEGDVVQVRVLDKSGGYVHVNMGMLIGDSVISKQQHWWADENGRLKRPLTFVERGLKLGTRVGGFVVIDPFTYEGLDTDTERAARDDEDKPS